MPGPNRYLKDGKLKSKTPMLRTGEGSRPLTKRERFNPSLPAEQELGIFSDESKARRKSKRQSSKRQSTTRAAKKRQSAGTPTEFQSSILALKKKYAPDGRTKGEASLRRSMNQMEREQQLDDAAVASVPNATPVREARIRRNTSLTGNQKAVKEFKGRQVVGKQPPAAIIQAAQRGQLRKAAGGNLTTPQVRKARRKVKGATRKLTAARKAATSRIAIPGDEGIFVNTLARKTGLSPRVIAAWIRAEGGNSTGDWNRLNIGHTDSGPIGLTADGGWSNPRMAADLTAKFLKGEYGGASAAIQNILPMSKGASDQQQILNITDSGWATNPQYTEDVTAVYNEVGEPVTRANTKDLKAAKKEAAAVQALADELGIKGVGGIKMGKGKSGAREPIYINFSRKGGEGTSSTKWLVPTGGNEVLKFQTPLARALVGLAKASGDPISVNSGFRSTEEQAELYAAYQAGTGNLAAPPGSSNHEGGKAADVELTDEQRSLAPQFGLGFPVPGEDWHIELVGDAANALVDGSGVSSSGVSSSGVSSSGVSSSGGGGSAGSGPAARKGRRSDVLEKLRELGFNVTASGVKKTGLAAGSASKAKPSAVLTELQKEYGR
jgi:hypothetical protein